MPCQHAQPTTLQPFTQHTHSNAGLHTLTCSPCSPHTHPHTACGTLTHSLPTHTLTLPAALSVYTVVTTLLLTSSRKPQAPVQDAVPLCTHLSTCWPSCGPPQSGEVSWLCCSPSHQQ